MKGLNDIKISHKLIGGFLATSLFVGVVGGIGITNMSQINENAKTISESNLLEIQAMSAVNYTVTETKSSTNELINIANKNQIEKIATEIDNLAKQSNGNVSKYEQLELTDAEKKEFEQFKISLKEYREARGQLLELVRQGNYEKAIELSETDYKGKRDKVINEINFIIEKSMKESEEIKDKNEALYESSFTIMLSIIGVGLLLSIALGLYLSRNISRRINGVVDFADGLGKGDLTQTIPFSSNDEIGKMSNSLNKAVENMRNLVSEIISGSQEMSATTEELSATMEEISVSMESVTETTQETTRGIEELSASTEEISASSEEIEHSSNELSVKSNEGGKKSEEIKIRADNVKSQAVASATSAINLYEEKQSKINQAIEQAKVVSQIGLLADTIGEIANQTNLLSLNASIEAARAGESGRGFAVVANEVRNLAEQSNASASNIRQVITEVQRAFDDMTNISMEVMEFINTQVKPDYELLVEVGDTYQKDAEFVMDMSNEIAVASKAISDSISEVSASLLNVSATTEQTSSGSETVLQNISLASDSVREVANAIQSQAEMAEKLSRMSQQFKV
ncbi:methyl-accepting chemotaxis protein [Bacillus sp. M6-12]|uniref:methyl-accepting chemotaxis protein n=1 Tax=Bacillus sp. M6-12 TaxID=2054166 RepID=UPI000C78100C|nr:methyl-accepting chemotaxis protein [Bacillus sp. M6-12]PLS19091.1 methyl-accepting chemotaxis protein [Bacillus sp. M6-12]